MLLDDLGLDAELEGFLSGKSSGLGGFQPQPATLGQVSEEQGALTSALPATGGVSAGPSGMAGRVVQKNALPPHVEQAGRFLQHAQPWRQFLLPLSLPASRDSCSRLAANAYNFHTNYAVLFVAQLVLAIVLQPSALFCIVLTAMAWALFLKKIDEPGWAPVLWGVILSPLQLWGGMTAGTALVLLCAAGGAIVNASLLFLVCAAVHGVLHDPSERGGMPGDDIPL